MNEKLDIFEILSIMDYGARDVWADLTEDQRNSVVFFLINRWISSVNGSRERQELAVLKTNEYLNKNLFDIPASKHNDHRQLLWHLSCMSGDTGRKERHQWIKLRKSTTSDPRTEFLHKLKPELGSQEVRLLAQITTDTELYRLAEEHGLEKPKFK